MPSFRDPLRLQHSGGGRHPGCRRLSGLAKAFIYAGTRPLQVSHWAVYSAAAEQLTMRMFAELAREPGLGSAEALRRAMLALIEGGGRLAHPAAGHRSS